MEKTEKKSAEDILFQCYVKAEKGDGTTEVELKAMHEYAAQELAEYKAKLNELFLKRKQGYHTDCLNDNFTNGRFWECQEMIELINKL